MKYIQSSSYLELGYLKVLKQLCREINTPYSQKCLRELNRNFVRFDRLDLDLRSYTDPVSMIKDRLVNGLVTKCPTIPTLEDPTLNCLTTFNRFEAQCLETNERFASDRNPESDVTSVLFGARRKIAKILGDVPKPSDLSFTFGPGATRNVKRRTSVFAKLTAEPECTLESRAAVLRTLATVPRLWTLWGGTSTSFPKLKIVQGSRFGQVPKSAKTNRPIDVEPTLNGVLQRGYGSVIKNRLAANGNCIRSGQKRHSDLARYASVMKTLATIDFSGASDSIASMVVLDLLPLDWFEALNDCRSHRHFIEDEWKNLQKFSSMGNGFTFELETLIFLSLARATCDHLGISSNLVSVYGDDVIIPTDAVDLFFKVSEWCGFTINADKSFWGSDEFRESCGSDYFNGVDVRVAYMRNAPSPHYLITLLNRLTTLGLDHLVPDTVSELRALVPGEFRRYGPPSDHMYGYIHSWDHLGSRVLAIKFQPREYRPQGRVMVAYALYHSVSVGDPGNDISELYNRLRFNRTFDRYVQFYGVALRRLWDSQHEHFSDIGGMFDAPISMERFTVRKDFKLSTVVIPAL